MPGPDSAPHSSAPSTHSVPAAPLPSHAAPPSGSRSGTRSGSHSGPCASTPPVDTVSDVVRWAAFSCVLVPVILLWYGSSLAGAAGTALGLAAVTGACLLLLRQSERGPHSWPRSGSRPRSAGAGRVHARGSGRRSSADGTGGPARDAGPR